MPELYSRLALPKKSSATPADVRKACGLPAKTVFSIWGYAPVLLGRSPKSVVNRNGSAERFRTSGGRAAVVNHFLGKALPTADC
jgi:hypothetical protein